MDMILISLFHQYTNVIEKDIHPHMFYTSEIKSIE